jgi:hypothetical protein
VSFQPRAGSCSGLRAVGMLELEAWQKLGPAERRMNSRQAISGSPWSLSAWRAPLATPPMAHTFRREGLNMKEDLRQERRTTCCKDAEHPHLSRHFEILLIDFERKQVEDPIIKADLATYNNPPAQRFRAVPF